ncbi:MAG: hypothetical protein Q9219_004337 [cf. Caloplaca sp. 3 TL-2023]
MVEAMDHSYAFHHHTRTLASTVVPVHSDASASTSVTASPMELLEDFDPPIELKSPLPHLELPHRPVLEAMSRKAEVTPVAERRGNEDSQTLADTDGSKPQQPGQDCYGGDETDHSRETNGDQPVDHSLEQANADCTPSPLTRIAAVSALIDLEQYHKDQATSLQSALDSLTMADGLSRRLIPRLSLAYQAMTDCYLAGDQAMFADLYRISEDISNNCKSDGTVKGLGVDLPASLPNHGLSRPGSWLERLPNDCQDHVLTFITRLRSDPHFLADRLSTLSPRGMAKLLSDSHTSQDTAPVFGSYPQRQGNGFIRNISSQGTSAVLEKLGNFPRGDPFFVLFHVVFDTSYGPGTAEYLRRTHVWANACARMISEGKPGSDTLTRITLDAFSETSGWHLSPQIESYMAQLLQEGAFLVDPVYKLSNRIQEPLEIRNANAAIATSNFFDKAVKDLLSILLSASPTDMMPDGLLHIIRSVLLRISNAEVRSRARKFIITRWFTSSFLGRILTCPEVSEPTLSIRTQANSLFRVIICY